ncbi:MAG: hypothetical protein ABJQ71_11845 [Roseibium sp.]
MISELSSAVFSQSDTQGWERNQDTSTRAQNAVIDAKSGKRAQTSVGADLTSFEQPEFTKTGLFTEEWSRANESANEAYAAMHLEELHSFIRERLAEIELLEPKPAGEVGADEAEAVRKALAQDGTRVTFPEDGIFMAIHDSLMYTFTEDGKVTAHESGVPQSQAEKDSWLSDLRNSIAELEMSTGGLSLEELRANYEAASQEATRVVEGARQQQVETGQKEDLIV